MKKTDIFDDIRPGPFFIARLDPKADDPILAKPSACRARWISCKGYVTTRIAATLNNFWRSSRDKTRAGAIAVRPEYQ